MNDRLNEEISRAKQQDKLIMNEINTFKDSLGTILTEIQDLKDKNDIHDQAQLKDRICQAYTYYHAKGEWNVMEKEALECLIQGYEATKNGANSFVHTVVQPEMYTWKIIP